MKESSILLFCIICLQIFCAQAEVDLAPYKAVADKARSSKLDGHGVAGHGMQERVTKFTNIYNAFNYKTGAEIGVWQGTMARGVLENVSSLEKYYLVDPWKHLENWNKPFNKQNSEFERVYNVAMKATEQWASKRVVMRGESIKMAANIEDDSLDFVYIDGDHTARGTMIDVLSWWPKIKLGGVLFGDDFVDSMQHGTKHSPTMVKSVGKYTIFTSLTDSFTHSLTHSFVQIYSNTNN